MFLDMGDVEKVNVLKKLNPDEQLKIGSSHFFYGNMDDTLIRLKASFRDKKRFEGVLAGKSISDLEGYLGTCERCIEEVDRLIAMLGILPSAQEELFEFRLLPYILRDNVLEVLQRSKKSGVDSLKEISVKELVEYAEIVTGKLDELFQKKRRLVDSMVKYRGIHANVRLVASLPYVLIYRNVGVVVCRLRKVPYTDPWAYSLEANYLKVWREKNHFTIDEAAVVLGMAKKRYRDLEYGYSRAGMVEWEPVKKHLRGEVDYSQFRDICHRAD